ncbi:hypothetical protein BY458DRAFT_504663 [Sporodiniella umbellata]|nr:hypothetical protein BY458DRAFT_504663 [Sporodiniella umbellata]
MQKKKTVNTSANSKRTISVTENSSPDQILYSSWLFLTSFQFFFMLKNYFKLDNWSLEKLEKALLQKETNQWLQNSLIQIISPLLDGTQSVDQDNYEDCLFYLFPEFGPSVENLTIVQKIRLLKRIEDANLENEHSLVWRNEADEKSLRFSALGKDNQGWSYWHFGNRLYREAPISFGKRIAKTLNENHLTFELICSTKQEWEKLLQNVTQKDLFKSKSTSAIITEIAEDTLAKIKAQETSQARREARSIKEKKYELAPKKKSRRLEAKMEEKNKRLKIQKEQEFDEKSNQEAKKKALLVAKENFKKDTKQKKAEEQLYLVADKQLRNDAYSYVKNHWDRLNDTKSTEEIRRLKHTHAQENSVEEKIVKMRGWLGFLRKYENVSIFLVKSDGQLNFQGDNEVLKHSLFKMILRTFFLHQQEDLGVLKNLLFNRYSSLKKFSEDLNQLKGDTSLLLSVWQNN